MPQGSVHATQLIALSILFLVTAFALVARRLSIPYPIVLVAGGVLVGLIPGVPAVNLNPEVIFLVVLPPLLYSTGWATSWRELSRSFVNVAMLAIGLVAFTTLGVAIAGPLLFPGFDWRIGLALGAAAATTDAIAATSIARRLSLPGRIADLLENESLLNDATGLLALEFAIAAVESGQIPSFAAGMTRLAWLLFAGSASGLIVARIVEWFERRIDDGPIEIGISFLCPTRATLQRNGCMGPGRLPQWLRDFISAGKAPSSLRRLSACKAGPCGPRSHFC
jgi:NhaP-type Na+/H+ or K+/H+ antiporter